MSKWFYPVLVVLLLIGLVVVKYDQTVVYKDKPTPQQEWCSLPLAVGTKGAIDRGDLSGFSGVVAGKDRGNCVYYVKFQNKDIWDGNGVHYQSVNADNFIEVKL